MSIAVKSRKNNPSRGPVVAKTQAGPPCNADTFMQRFAQDFCRMCLPNEEAKMSSARVDFEKWRLRTFVQKLIEIGDVEIHDEPVSLLDLSSVIEATPKATLFKRVGPEGFEMVAAVGGSRQRLALALGVDTRHCVDEYERRLGNPQPVIEVPSHEAPVHQVVRTGDDIDLTKLPFHIQHEFDGCVYISSAIDYTVDPTTGKGNVGCRRLMLRDRTTMRTNLTWASDLKRIYLGCVGRGEKLPISFAIGANPVDFMAATLRLPGDEFGLVATLRGEPVPMVRGLTNGILAPADAELVIEGYLDERGYVEQEGPYGEFWGYYGPVHIDPVYHVTAITMRKDVLHQTVLHGTSRLTRTEAANVNSISAELRYLKVLRAANIEPTRVHSVVAAQAHARVALRRGFPGQARRAIAALFSLYDVKHVVVVDDDVDIFADDEIEWALSTRFQADRDTVVSGDFTGAYMDPTLRKDGNVSKIGFDATAPYDTTDEIVNWRPSPPRIENPPRFQTIRQALESSPMFFLKIMEAVGSKDGREVAVELGALHRDGLVARLNNGEWSLKARP
jgi:UbiD family decarboxylase